MTTPMRMDMDLHGIDGVLRTLRSLPKEVVSKRGGPVKLALAKGARLLRDYEKANLRAVIAQHGDDSTGLLEESIIASRGKEPRGTRGERYLVRIKRKTYPDREGKPVTTLKTAHLKEYGSVNQPATPFIRPTVKVHAVEAIHVVTRDLLRRVDNVVRKLERQNNPRPRGRPRSS